MLLSNLHSVIERRVITLILDVFCFLRTSVIVFTFLHDIQPSTPSACPPSLSLTSFCA